MNWFIKFLTSSIGRKLLMALTGLFLILFLVVHLAGNLQLLHNDEGRAFNEYAMFMAHFGPIQLISKVNYALILLHVIISIVLTRKNASARGSQSYAIPNNKSEWSSRNMGILGTLILIFLVFHLQGFWWKMHYGGLPELDYDGKKVTDLFTVVNTAYHLWWYVLIYVVSMAVLAFHLWHGFISAFQTLGLNHPKYNPVIKFVGKAFAIIVPALFAMIPIVMYFK